MNEKIKSISEHTGLAVYGLGLDREKFERALTRYTDSVVKECINKIETYQIPVGNSAAGEMACEWTYDALKEIRAEIKEHFGVET
jgi:hypothetical protein